VARGAQPISRDAESYSLHVTGIPIRDVRRDFFMAIMGGINEVNFRKLEKPEIEAQWKCGRGGGGPEIPAVARVFGSQRQRARRIAEVASGHWSMKI